MPRAAWLAEMRAQWRQGQHVAIMGRTGRGKTTLARDLMACRSWAIVLGVKRDDDVLATFEQAGYKRVKSWPPEYHQQRVLYWPRPKDLDDVGPQAANIRRVLNEVYRNGGWALFLDDVAYIANRLGFKRDIGILLNQARSSRISMVTAMTQPSSVTQAIPSEVWRQVRFHLVFYYRVGRDLESIADITGYPKAQLQAWMAQLRPYDFLAFDDLTDSVLIVRS